MTKTAIKREFPRSGKMPLTKYVPGKKKNQKICKTLTEKRIKFAYMLVK